MQVCLSLDVAIPKQPQSITAPYIEQYLDLREKLEQVQRQGTRLFLLQKPTGGLQQVRELLHSFVDSKDLLATERDLQILWDNIEQE